MLKKIIRTLLSLIFYPFIFLGTLMWWAMVYIIESDKDEMETANEVAIETLLVPVRIWK